MPGIIAIILIDNPDPIMLKITIGTQFKLFTEEILFDRGCRPITVFTVSCDWNLAYSYNRFHKAVIVKLNYFCDSEKRYRNGYPVAQDAARYLPSGGHRAPAVARRKRSRSSTA
jgi:hypothetical protein